MTDNTHDTRGFTLIEILISLAISSIVLIAIYQAFSSQEKTNITQQQLIELQQNLRAAFIIMTREIRLAGYNQIDSGIDGIGIEAARPGLLRFTKDDNTNEPGNPNGIGDGDTDDENENITYGFPDSVDSKHTGDLNTKAATLGRQTCRPAGCSGFLPLAESIQAIRFEYAFDNNGDDQLDTDAGGNIIWAVDSDGDGQLNYGTGVPLDRIRAVRVSILGRTKSQFRDITDTQIYQMGSIQVGPFNDTYRRRLLTTVVQCRNVR